IPAVAFDEHREAVFRNADVESEISQIRQPLLKNMRNIKCEASDVRLYTGRVESWDRLAQLLQRHHLTALRDIRYEHACTRCCFADHAGHLPLAASAALDRDTDVEWPLFILCQRQSLLDKMRLASYAVHKHARQLSASVVPARL